MFLIILLITFFITLYLLLVMPSQETKEKEKNPEEEVIDSALVHIVHHKKKYSVSVNEKLNTLHLDIPRNAEVFKLIKKKNSNLIGLYSLKCKGMIMINCTAFYNKTYDIDVKGQTLENMGTQLKLKRNIKNKNYYLKFYNSYYLCNDKNGYLFAGKDKKDIMYFKLESAKNY